MTPRASKAFRGCSAFLVAAFLASHLGAQTTWYVDANGTPPGTGTPSDPFTSIQAALDEPALGAGDTIEVAPGVYLEALQTNKAGFTVVSTGGPLVTTIRGPGGGPVIRIDSATLGETTFAGFTIAGGSGSTGYGFWGFSGQTHVTGSILTDNEWGMTGYEARLTYSTVSGNQTGIRIIYGTNITIENTVFDGNLQDFVHFCHGSSYDIVNSIFDSSALDPSCGSISGSYNGDPELWDTSAGDVHLRPGSPAIGMGAGSPISERCPTTRATRRRTRRLSAIRSPTRSVASRRSVTPARTPSAPELWTSPAARRSTTSWDSSSTATRASRFPIRAAGCACSLQSGARRPRTPAATRLPTTARAFTPSTSPHSSPAGPTPPWYQAGRSSASSGTTTHWIRPATAPAAATPWHSNSCRRSAGRVRGSPVGAPEGSPSRASP